MRISNRSYPILKKLHEGILGNIPIFDCDQSFFTVFGQMYTNNWKFFSSKFRLEINFVSESFQESANKCFKNLLQLVEDILKNDSGDLNVSGTYLVGDFVFMIYYDVKKGIDENEIYFYMFDKKGVPLAMMIDSAKYNIHQNIWVSSCFGLGKNEVEIKNWIYSKIFGVIIFRMFKTYSKVETKIIPPNSKIKDNGFKCLNEVDFEINYLDSKWFTNIIRSEGFNVSGHFRLQPKKTNRVWTKELIWINGFKKNGYSSKARKI